MALLRLPTEILGRIIQETLPESFENFVMTCKTVFQASNFLRQKHNALRSRYRDFEYDLASDGDTCTSSLQLITKIADEPLIARYIVFANLKEDSPPEDHEIAAAHIREMRADSKVLSLFENSPYLRSAGVDPESVLEYMIHHYTPDDHDPGLSATFLLTVLPNVTELSLPKRWEAFGDGELGNTAPTSPWNMSAILNYIVVRANDASDHAASLSKLTTLLPSTGWGYENRWRLSTFTPFLSIKSMRNFCAGSCRAIDDGYTGAKFDNPEHDTFGANLEVVELVGAVVDDLELRKFLSRMPLLRTFKLSYETKWHGCGHDWDAGAVMAVIEEEVGEHLENLSFTILNCYGDSGSGVGSMGKFKKLKEVELDIEVLLGPQHRLGELARTDELVAGIGDREIPRLGELLPPTVEKFCLVVHNWEDNSRVMNRLFSNIAADKDEKLPSLKEIIIRNHSEGILEENSEGLDDVALNELEDLEDHEVENTSHASPNDKPAAPELDEESNDSTSGSGDADPSAMSELEPTTQAPAEPAEPRTWDADLEALGKSVDVKLIKVDECDEYSYGYGTVMPYFMRNFCTRYGVECV